MFGKRAVAFLAALILAPAAYAAAPQYFVDVGAGSAQARLGEPSGTGYRRDGNDVASAIRVGVRWRGRVSLGIETGLDLDALVEAGQWISAQLGRRSNSRAGNAIAAKRAARQEAATA